MDKNFFKNETKIIVQNNFKVEALAIALSELWKQGETKSTNLVKKEQSNQAGNLGIAVSVLKQIGQIVGKHGGSHSIDMYLKLSELLWNDFGREGRIVASHILGGLNEKSPERVLLLCKSLVANCFSWEECDNMTYGVEPIIRKHPEKYLEGLKVWLEDDNKWVKRVALNVLARLPMKQANYTKQSLDMVSTCLFVDDIDVRRTCSFAIRMAARGDIDEVYKYIEANLGGANYTKVWIFSDVIKSMAKQFLPNFKQLLPLYEQWRDQLTDPKSIKSIDSAIKVLKV